MRPHLLLGTLLAIAACNSSTPGDRLPDQGGGMPTPANDVEVSTEPLTTLASAVAMNKTTDQKMNLRARIMFNQSAFDIYEPAPGRAVYAELLQPGATSHRDAVKGGDGASGVWQRLSPGQPVPQALKDLDARADANARASARPGQTMAPTPPAKLTQAQTFASDGVDKISSAVLIACQTPPANLGSCNHTWFKTNMCDHPQPFGWSVHYNWCVYGWRDGRWEQDGSDDDNGYGAVMACTGNLNFSLTATYGGGSWTVAKGFSMWAMPGMNCGSWCYPFCDWCSDQSVRYNVSASGVSFDHCGGFGDSD